ncbi:MAG: DsbA family protein [Propionibacteriaceae bacterium]|nr:DsbA family protein [Propionibacteriaceae bacterium]
MTNARQRLHERKQAEIKRKKRLRTAVVIVIVLALIGGTASILLAYQQSLPPVPTANPSGAATTNPGIPPNASATNNGIAVNHASGVPLVEIFSDYQCGHCEQLERDAGQSFAALAASNQIQLVIRTRTFMDASWKNSLSTDSAVGAACADFAGAYLKYHQGVYAGMATMHSAADYAPYLRETLPIQAGISGLALTDFQKCYDTKQTHGFVRLVNETAHKDGFDTTPTVLVNGKELNTALAHNLSPEDLMALINTTK